MHTVRINICFHCQYLKCIYFIYNLILVLCPHIDFDTYTCVNLKLVWTLNLGFKYFRSH